MNIRSKVGATVLATACLLGLALAGHADDEKTAQAQPILADAQRAAPNFVGISNWLNSGPLNLADLRGKVVLVDFWTSGCINCARTLPYVTRLYDKYKGKGLVVVGVHRPEFPFERSTGTVQAAISRHGIRYPAAQDNGFATWKAYGNEYWPAQYIVDQSGRIVFEHAGEGQYDEIERIIQKLLNLAS
ncbi:MAG: redoxin family protein [Methyloceanibacter sp.]